MAKIIFLDRRLKNSISTIPTLGQTKELMLYVSLFKTSIATGQLFGVPLHYFLYIASLTIL